MAELGCYSHAIGLARQTLSIMFRDNFIKHPFDFMRKRRTVWLI